MTTKATKVQLETELKMVRNFNAELGEKLDKSDAESRRLQHAAQDLQRKNEGLENSLNEKDKIISAAKQAIFQHLKVEHQINMFDFHTDEDEKSVDVRFLRFLYEVL